MRVRLHGDEWKRLAAKVAALANEGWTISEIVELLNAEGKRLQGEPYTENYVHGILHRLKYVEKVKLRPDIRMRPGGPVALERRLARRKKKAQPKALVPRHVAWMSSAPMLAVALVTLLFVTFAVLQRLPNLNN
jgi:hypothetical protein